MFAIASRAVAACTVTENHKPALVARAATLVDARVMNPSPHPDRLFFGGICFAHFLFLLLGRDALQDKQ